MNRILGVTLGILSAIGGFVDIGDLVFNLEAGAHFGYGLLWAPAVGVVGIIVYSEMCGRVAAVSGRAVFDAVRERTGVTVGLATLVSAQIVNLMTCAAEVGGVAIVLQLLSAFPYRILLPVAVGLLVLAVWTLRFEWIERLFSLPGLCLVVFAAAALKLGPDWGAAGHGLVPHLPPEETLVYAYFAIGLLGAAMTPYEVYFYSSGAVEDGWSRSDLALNRITAMIGYGIGAFLSFALMIVAAEVFLPRGIEPSTLGSGPLAAQVAFGTVGLLLALVGILFAVGGAAVETCLSGAYALAQFFGWSGASPAAAARRHGSR